MSMQDFVRDGGWPVTESSSRLILVGDLIVVTPRNDRLAEVGVVRNGMTIAIGHGQLSADGILMADLGVASLTLQLVDGLLIFGVNENAPGGSPDGGGSAGNPGGNH